MLRPSQVLATLLVCGVPAIGDRTTPVTCPRLSPNLAVTSAAPLIAKRRACVCGWRLCEGDSDPATCVNAVETGGGANRCVGG